VDSLRVPTGKLTARGTLAVRRGRRRPRRDALDALSVEPHST